jgi:glucose/arabinose dehydrogenase
MTLRAALALLIAAAALAPAGRADLPLELITLPEGFKIDLFATDLPNARMIVRGANGTIFVSTRNKGAIYAVRDADGDFKAEQKWVIAEGLDTPNGVAFHEGALYVAEYRRLIRFDDIENRLDNPPAPVVLFDQFPEKMGHHWKYAAIGPDGWLYVNIGAPGNIVNMEPEDPRYATISRIRLDGTGLETYARGVRNSVGFTWHPETGHLWFTDNGRDWLGDDRPPCELNVATEAGQHFGYPFCHGGDLIDPEFGEGRSCDEFVAPAQNLGPHTAPLGLKFYTGDQFPAEYKNAILIAEHGSWNRSIPIGYRIAMVRLDEQGKSKGYEMFAEGWLQRTRAWGRPVDLLVLPDGSLLISDDAADCIYRVHYAG